MRMMLQNGSVMITVIERIDQKYGAVKALSLKVSFSYIYFKYLSMFRVTVYVFSISQSVWL